MEFLFWITFFVVLISGFYCFFIKKQYYNIFVFLIGGTYLPLFLYMLDWSSLITKQISNSFYLMFIYLNVITILTFIIFRGKFKYERISYSLKNEKIFFMMNIGYIVLYFFESYIKSGTIIPALKGIDIHTYSAPIIRYVTTNIYFLLVGNLVFFIGTKKKRYIIQLVILILIPIVTRGARMMVLTACMQVLFFGIYYYTCNRKSKIKKKYIVLIALICVMLLGFMVQYTNYRMNCFGKYNMKYYNTIEYTGPKFMRNELSVYYGYFPLSFNNLNINMIHKQSGFNYVGMATFRSLYYGILHLNTIFGINPYQANKNILITSTSANVPTGYYSFYYDFGNLSIIPIVIAIFIYGFLYNKFIKSKSFLWKLLYFYYTPLWIFMSFQNVLFATNVPYAFILIYMFYKLFIIEEKGGIK